MQKKSSQHSTFLALLSLILPLTLRYLLLGTIPYLHFSGLRVRFMSQACCRISPIDIILSETDRPENELLYQYIITSVPRVWRASISFTSAIGVCDQSVSPKHRSTSQMWDGITFGEAHSEGGGAIEITLTLSSPQAEVINHDYMY